MSADVKLSPQALEQELKDLAQSLSHDLRAPLRALDGFSRMLLEEHEQGLDEQGRDYLRRLREAAGQMNRQIEGLVRLARVSSAEVRVRPVDLTAQARALTGRMAEADAGRSVKVEIEDHLCAAGDGPLLGGLLEALLANAWKFTRDRPDAVIQMGRNSKEVGEEAAAFFVRDNGAGFDMRYAERLFHPFARLHRAAEFEGLGLGLAVARRVVNRHGGTIWAESTPGNGATFYFTLG